MKAVRYNVDLAYPEVKGLNHDKEQALLLMEGYSGYASELSTVTQYAYHKIRCEKSKELFETLQGILLVEMHHLELLGKCIIQLGMDPRYHIYMNQKPISWQSEVIQYKASMKEMIFADIEGEKGAANYYLQTAQTIESKKIAALLLRLAEDEKLHVKMFSELYHKHFA